MKSCSAFTWIFIMETTFLGKMSFENCFAVIWIEIIILDFIIFEIELIVQICQASICSYWILAWFYFWSRESEGDTVFLELYHVTQNEEIKKNINWLSHKILDSKFYVFFVKSDKMTHTHLVRDRQRKTIIVSKWGRE